MCETELDQQLQAVRVEVEEVHGQMEAVASLASSLPVAAPHRSCFEVSWHELHLCTIFCAELSAVEMCLWANLARFARDVCSVCDARTWAVDSVTCL